MSNTDFKEEIKRYRRMIESALTASDFDAARKILAKALQGADSHLSDIETGPYWKTQDAIQAFKEYVAVRHAVPSNHDHWTRGFLTHFRDKNIAEITPAEIEGFLFANWGECERSTWNQAKMKISGFYSFAIKELKRKGSPSFHNPCGLIDDMKNVKRKKHEFIRIDKMRELLDTFTKPSHWLWFHILTTAGLRISELTELRPMDVSGRVLTLGGGAPCKSGRPFGEEQAVIPQVVADRLKVYMAGTRDDERVFKTTHKNVWDVLDNRCKRLRMDHISAHDLHDWCASFWEQHGDTQMVNFIIRPSLGSRAEIYVKIISAEEAMMRQDQVMTPALIDNL